jgi:hypothetical protein
MNGDERRAAPLLPPISTHPHIPILLIVGPDLVRRPLFSWETGELTEKRFFSWCLRALVVVFFFVGAAQKG